MIYITSDTHFYHRNIIDYCDRPYQDVQTMNQDIIEKWNSVVLPEDLVVHLGDVGFGLIEQIKPIINQLNGYKVLIRGNHDAKRGINSWENIGFNKVYKCKEVPLNILLQDVMEFYKEDIHLSYTYFNNVIFSHNPRQCQDDTLNIHGHIHNAPLDTSMYNVQNHFCASIEMTEYKPILLQTILDIKSKR